MFRDPRKPMHAINNCVTVALPLTAVDIDLIVNKVLEQVELPGITGSDDVDITTFGLQDGSMLVYNEEKQQWQATITLEKQTVDAGWF